MTFCFKLNLIMFCWILFLFICVVQINKPDAHESFILIKWAVSQSYCGIIALLVFRLFLLVGLLINQWNARIAFWAFDWWKGRQPIRRLCAHPGLITALCNFRSRSLCLNSNDGCCEVECHRCDWHSSQFFFLRGLFWCHLGAVSVSPPAINFLLAKFSNLPAI